MGSSRADTLNSESATFFCSASGRRATFTPNGISPVQGALPAAASKAPCTGEIPFGVKVARLPDAEQKKAALSEFSVSAREDPMTYDLAMRVKNGSATWCVTSLAITYTLGDARGQEWVANE